MSLSQKKIAWNTIILQLAAFILFYLYDEELCHLFLQRILLKHISWVWLLVVEAFCFDIQFAGALPLDLKVVLKHILKLHLEIRIVSLFYFCSNSSAESYLLSSALSLVLKKIAEQILAMETSKLSVNDLWNIFPL